MGEVTLTGMKTEQKKGFRNTINIKSLPAF